MSGMIRNDENKGSGTCIGAADGYTAVSIAERPELLHDAADWFSSKWRIPREAYAESMEECLKNEKERGEGGNKISVPQWYVVLKDGKIIAGAGVIKNDFHNRPDLTPNVCAVYVEKEYRCCGIAGRMLAHVCEKMHESGIDTLYLLTDHTNFYERYGWTYLCPVQGDGDSEPSRMYVKRYFPKDD